MLAFVLANAAVAQDPPSTTPTQPGRPGAKTQPEPKGFPFGQPERGFPTPRVTAARMAALEEEFELVEAQRDVRRAHVQAAEIGLKGAELTMQNMERIAKNGVVSSQELDKAKLDVEAAKAQMQIKMAELKEIEVKVKYAKKRLDDAKAAGVRTAPTRPAFDPPPSPRGRDRAEW
jgi:hypothetical protein